MTIIVDVKIKGLTPLLQHRFDERAQQGETTRAVLVQQETPRDAAARAANKAPNGTFYFSGQAISRLLREAGSSHKLRGSRKSLRFIVPSAILVGQDTVTILNGDGKSPVKDFEVDSRPVTIPATKGRVMRHRPRFDDWSAAFTIEIEDDTLPPDMVQQLLTEGGRRLGIGDFRPEKGGPFGRFMVTEWNARA